MVLLKAFGRKNVIHTVMGAQFRRLIAPSTQTTLEMGHLVFVYGTLKKGEPNHYVLEKYDTESCKFIGSAVTKHRFPLVIASRYNIPFLLGMKDVGEKILGEVYNVNDAVLLELDQFENHPDYYTRTEEFVTLSSNNEQILVGIYILNTFKPELLNLPYLSNYSSEGPHGLKYVVSEETTSQDDI